MIPRDAETEAGQRRWYVCSNCSAVNYVDAKRGPGLCSAGGYHAPGRLEYLVAHDTDAVPGATGFHWCRKCENMVLGNNPPGCIAGANHDTSGNANYIVRTDPASLVREQPFWRTCTKCNTLFALNTSDASNEKPCAAGGTHSPTGEYFLTFVTSGQNGGPTDIPFWRWCSKCESMAFWDGSRAPGPCPAGGTHDHNTSAFYGPPSFQLDVAQVVDDNLLVGESWSDAENRVRFEVLTMDGASAMIRVTATSTAWRSGSGVVRESPRPL